MEAALDIATFVSDQFVPFLPEESQVNPEVYGAELAWWLASELARRNVFTSYPEYEDWGWYLTLVTDTGSEFMLACGNVVGTRNRWTLMLRRFPKKLFGRGKPSFEEAGPLLSALHEAVHSAGSLSDLEWHWPLPIR